MTSLRSDPSPAATDPLRLFLVQGVLWNLLLFGLIRLAWVDRHFLQAIVDIEQSIVRWYAGAPHTSLVVTTDCSGADVMALCAGVTLAYPAAWRRRLAGLAGCIGVILVLNVGRIATLYEARTVASLDWLHRFVWPIVLLILTVAYVFWWMLQSDARHVERRGALTRITRPLIVATLAYAAAVPWVFTSAWMHHIGAWTAACGAVFLRGFGTTVHASADVLVTSRGGFQVTPECLFTPVLPLYAAAMWALPVTRAKRTALLAGALPLFFALGVIRLLALALPPLIIEHPAFLAHGFYQLVLGISAIIGAAYLGSRAQESGFPVKTRAVIAIISAIVVATAVGGLWQQSVLWLTDTARAVVPVTRVVLSPPGDQQGALAMLPVYQLAVLAGLWVAFTAGRGWLRFAAGVLTLAVTQVVFLIALAFATAQVGVAAHAIVIRAWAVIVPLAIALTWVDERATLLGDAGYRRFWWHVGDDFPSLTGARSTRLYFENEKRLISAALPSLEGLTVLKTDLWDEAKNTRILQWVAEQRARVYGIDISEPIVREARAAFDDRQLRPAVSDVRRLPFANGSFDAIYSMGTIEHFAETEASVVELARVLKPGGRLILGVPNRHDPFLRPAFVWFLSKLGLYAYGFEKSYSRRALRNMLERAGLEVALESGILFIPGWLRMLDLWCYTRFAPAARLTGALVRPFEWLEERCPPVHRYGYLLASVGVKRKPHVGRIDGVEYVIDANGCDPGHLRSLPRLAKLFDEVVTGLSLNPVAAPQWHVFPDPGGITGVLLLAESHLTIHTYPEAGLAAINLYCCRGSIEWRWDERLVELLGARGVTIRSLSRGRLQE